LKSLVNLFPVSCFKEDKKKFIVIADCLSEMFNYLSYDILNCSCLRDNHESVDLFNEFKYKLTIINGALSIDDKLIKVLYNKIN
jgi:hypothetical protein